MKTRVLLLQLGSPKSPRVKDVRSFLKEFLGDPRVVDINPLAWKIILNLFVLPFRPSKSAQLYSRIWDEKKQTFPLIEITEEFAKKLDEKMDGIDVKHAFLLSKPRIKEVLSEWEKEGDFSEGEILVVPLFPQFSESTTTSCMDMFNHALKDFVSFPSVKFLNCFHKSKAFVEGSVRQIETFLENEKADDVVISFHGIPKRRVIQKDDPYYRHCFETYTLIKERLDPSVQNKLHFTFQSRFGSEEWLGPYTDEYVENLAEKGSKHIAVYCPSFVADCLETIDEIGNELPEEVREYNCRVSLIPCLNTDEKWISEIGEYFSNEVASEKKENQELEFKVASQEYDNMPEVKMEQTPFTPEAKSTLKIIFLTLFLDLVGFSIIFPLFPALAKHYLTVDGDNYFLNLIFNTISSLVSTGGGAAEKFSGIVLFGGALGALYSLLQFVAAPIWGVISDRIGRKPVLLVSVFGLAFSYLLWFFSGSFTLLIFARFIGGIMGGNISTATAVVADITDKTNRSKGMATIGIAFALGFIIGPAMGGILSLIDLTKFYPVLADYGVNPFSMPAALAFLLGMLNVYLLATKFKESLPEEKRGKNDVDRSANPLKLFKPLPYPGINLTNFGHFFFLTAFSGMEFTLTFLAAERLNFSSMDNAYMFIFIGFVIAFVQGGVVRRKASKVGEKKMALMGLICLIPGLVLIGFTKSIGLLYLGLFFLAVGSSMAIPCLTSLVSLYTPAQEQGKSIGIFRSLGALSRVIGPIIASVVYWHLGSGMPYYLGAIFLLLPVVMVIMLPQPKEVHAV